MTKNYCKGFNSWYRITNYEDDKMPNGMFGEMIEEFDELENAYYELIDKDPYSLELDFYRECAKKAVEKVRPKLLDLDAEYVSRVSKYGRYAIKVIQHIAKLKQYPEMEIYRP